MAQNSIREIKEGDQEQGSGETISWIFKVDDDDTAPTSVSSVVVESYNQETQAFTDVTSTNMPTGSASISGREITLPALTALAIGTKYRITVHYVAGGNTQSAFMWVHGKK